MRRRAVPAPLRLTLLALCLAVATLWGNAARAADPYRAELVPVDVTAADAVTARAQAIAEGEREGLRQVLMRLTLPETPLPDLAGVDLDRMVRSFEVAEEQVSATRYIAKLNINYDPAAVDRLLGGAGTAFVQRAPDPVLIVPAMRRGGAWAIWDEGPWRAAWNARARRSGLLEILLPLGDAEDVASFPPEALAASYYPGLETLAARYGAVSAYVAALELPEGGLVPGSPVRVELLGSTFEAAPAPVTVSAGADPEAAAMLAPVVEAAVAALELGWKRDNLVRSTAAGSIAVEVPLADLPAWVQIRRDLETLPVLRRLRIDSLERERASLTIDYMGEPRDLEAALMRVGLALAQENDRWRLLPAGGRGVVRVPPGPLPRF
jgi:hypothetical protein